MYQFLLNVCEIKQEDIILVGRSIGAGPACWLARKFSPSAVALINPFKSIKEVAKAKLGRVTNVMSGEWFNNLEAIKSMSFPLALIHGYKDSVVSFNHSFDLL